jgi:hypothetical protein
MKRSPHVRATVVAALIGSAVATAPSFAQDMFTVGAGSKPCTFLNSRRATPEGDIAENVITAMTFGWAQGYMSALNVATAKIDGQMYDLASIRPEQQWKEIVDYCRRNPSKQIIEAVHDLMARFQRRPAPQ